ncbi:xylose isomerase [Actinoplanes sp. OR16]|uniref:sugar phosphate isomerase/epimerase family protein n=1 Tax=Actinoplanes sp. OR16 TaxID=946334 RepID=UPI000F6BFC2C|nr:sugar phosphate isomerase/epimerase family protein [Actinoplanes sp. OR16]BBH68429.1 xylose isomerase [Actinoplanes sp. OR16]
MRFPDFAVSTLGCPGLPLGRVAALLRAHGVAGVELRCAPDEPVHTGLSPAARRAARAALDGLRVVTLASYVNLTSGGAGLAEHLDLARDLGAATLRLMPGGTGRSEEHLGPAAETLAKAVVLARGSGVRLVVETHDAFLNGADLRRLFERAGVGTEAGVVWDALHPWRAGETPAATAAALGPWLAEVQVKDVAGSHDLTPVVPGRGSVPNAEIVELARRQGFTGPVVLELEARWYPDAPSLDAAIEGARGLAG